jgi:leucyl/phenylalanyl-tRNA--protein transferase
MPIYTLDTTPRFPDPSQAEADGLLAMGGDLSPARILAAYKRGIFPWFDGTVPLWWSPDPRFVLFPASLKVSDSMRSVIRKQTFTYTRNEAFDAVITACKSIKREGQQGTWITRGMQQAYTSLHTQGYAMSAEAWKDGQLAGGLYGVKIGRIFYGESMFSRESNASKFAFIKLVEELSAEGVVLIDCQVYTQHLESLGAKMIPRKVFLNYLKEFAVEDGQPSQSTP